MTFEQAIRSGFDHYTKFDGRANRPAFWYWVLFAFAAGVAANIVDVIIGTQILSYLLGLALLLPGISVAIRRLHDTNRTGWWYLLVFTIVGIIVLIIFWAEEGDAGDNKYGPPMAAPVAA